MRSEGILAIAWIVQHWDDLRGFFLCIIFFWGKCASLNDVSCLWEQNNMIVKEIIALHLRLLVSPAGGCECGPKPLLSHFIFLSKTLATSLIFSLLQKTCIS